MSKEKAVRTSVFITGESPLVEEYTAACLNAGMSVTVRPNAPGTGQLPRGVLQRSRITPGATIALELTNTSREAKRVNLVDLDRVLSPGTPLLTSAIATTVAEQAQWVGRPGRLVGIAGLPTLLRGELMEMTLSHATGDRVIAAARQFFAALGKETSIVQDSPGMVLPRILCMLVNEACFALGESIATRGDIDTAMKLGMNYPHGPLEWAEQIGIAHVRAVLSGMHRDLGEDRYRSAPFLLRASAAGTMSIR